MAAPTLFGIAGEIREGKLCDLRAYADGVKHTAFQRVRRGCARIMPVQTAFSGNIPNQ